MSAHKNNHLFFFGVHEQSFKPIKFNTHQTTSFTILNKKGSWLDPLTEDKPWFRFIPVIVHFTCIRPVEKCRFDIWETCKERDVAEIRKLINLVGPNFVKLQFSCWTLTNRNRWLLDWWTEVNGMELPHRIEPGSRLYQRTTTKILKQATEIKTSELKPAREARLPAAVIVQQLQLNHTPKKERERGLKFRRDD